MIGERWWFRAGRFERYLAQAPKPLRANGDLCYAKQMRTAYLGIADRDRLLAWWPENPFTARFLERRQVRHPRELCFWAVLPSEEAERVSDCLRCGQLTEALDLLQQVESEIGRILPRPTEPLPRA